MRMLFAADVPPDPNSGASGTCLQTIDALRDLGHHVDTIWEHDLRHFIRHGNLHYLLELPGAYRDAIEERCCKCNYDVIHVDQPYAWLAARDHQIRRRPGVFMNRSHGWEPSVDVALRMWRTRYGEWEWRFPRGIVGRPIRWVLHRLYPQWVARHTDGIIVSSAHDRDFILSQESILPDRVACIPQAPAKVFHLRPVAPLTPGRLRRALYVGQYAFVKGCAVLAQVFSRLAVEASDLEITWCCPESAHAGVKQLLSGPAQHSVRLVPWMPQEQLVDLYDEHGVFVFPSFYEGFGKAFIEAMSRGLFVVASDTGGMQDVITDGRDGRLVPVGDVAGFVAAVQAATSDPVRTASIAQSAVTTASSYTWERAAQETVDFCVKLQAMRASDHA
jgi:glycosyltransferase involved in cell wall biosynthesis